VRRSLISKFFVGCGELANRIKSRITDAVRKLTGILPASVRKIASSQKNL
jgi:hypothetical protein